MKQPSWRTLYCSFCAKSQHDVQTLITGSVQPPTCCICNECVDECVKIVAERKAATGAPPTMGSTSRKACGGAPGQLMGKHGSSNWALDLQELIRKHGGYDKIPPEAWAEYDRAMAEWQERRRSRAEGGPGEILHSDRSAADPGEQLCLCGLAGVYWRPRQGGGRPIWRCEAHRDRWPDYADGALKRAVGGGVR